MLVKLKYPGMHIEGVENSISLPADTILDMPDEKAATLITSGLLDAFNPIKFAEEKAAEKEFEQKELKEMMDAAEKSVKDEIIKGFGLDPADEKVNEKLAQMQDMAEKYAKEQKKNGGQFKTLGENVQAIAAQLGLPFKGATEIIAKSMERGVQFKAPTGQGELVDADGGFLVDTEFDTLLNNRLMETALLMSRTNVRQIGINFDSMKWNNVINYNRTDTNHPSQVFYVPEADAITASIVNFEQITLALLKLAGLNFLTGEILQDVVNLEGDITDIFGNEFGWKIDNGIFEGAGGTNITGVLGAGANVAVTRDTIAQLNVADVTAMYSRLWTGSKTGGNTAWFINPDIVPSLQAFSIGNMPVYTPQNSLANSPHATLLGKPLIELEHCKTLGTLGDINLWDLSQYRTIEKGGISIASSEHVRFVNYETALRFIKRVNGIPMWTTVQTPQNGTSTVSPFVSLAT